MYLKINRNFQESEFGEYSNSNDYDLFEKDGISVFIYGYPYTTFQFTSWMTAKQFWIKYNIEGPEYITELEGISELEGIFSIIILDKNIEKCFVIIDRWGIYTCFHYISYDFLIISDKIETIFKFMENIEINKKSVVEMLTLGFRIGNETQIKYIHSFEAGHIYDFNIDKSTTYEYQNLNVINQEFDKHEFLKLYRNHISTLLELDNKPILTLTGGLDTRTILSCILRDNRKPHCITFGVKNSKDIKISRKISDKFRLTHSTYILDDRFINVDIPFLIENNINMFNGLIPTMHYLQFEKLCKHGRDKLLILGILGDEIWRQSNITVQKKFLDIFKEKYDFSLPKDNKQILMSNWAGNLIKYLGKYHKIGMGLFYNDIIYDLDNLKDIQKYIIDINNGELAKIPYDSGNKIINKIKEFSNRVWNKYFHRKLFKHFPNYPHYYNIWLRKYHKDFVLRILNWNNMVLRDLFEKEKLNRVVNQFLKGDDSYFTFLISLLSLEMWFKNMKKIVRVD